MENQNQVFHTSHRPLQIPQTRRDSHISTGSTTAASHRKTKPKKGARPLRGLAILLSLLLRSIKAYFMLIFQLENAPGQFHDRRG
jgi:predicted neuraminidase